MRKLALPTVALTGAVAAALSAPLAVQSKPLSERLREKRAELSRIERRESVLTTDISSLSARIEGINGRLRATRAQLGQVQRRLDHERARLARIQARLERARYKLARLRARLAEGRRVLAARLVAIYKSDRPDAWTVVLESDGFAELLDRLEYLQRLADSDTQVVDRVRTLSVAAKRRADELAALESAQRRTALAVLEQRDRLAATRQQLASTRAELASARGERRALLARVRRTKAHVEEDLAALEAAQRRVQQALVAAAPRAFAPGAAGPVRRGSGRFIWPVNGPITGVFGEARPGHMHAGIDISAPSGTPIRAADSGVVVLAGWVSGYGNFVCVQHTASLSTCYAHLSGYATSRGASVRQGQVIGYVGSTGNSTGPHLHFEVRVGGSPVNPMAYL